MLVDCLQRSRPSSLVCFVGVGVRCSKWQRTRSSNFCVVIVICCFQCTNGLPTTSKLCVLHGKVYFPEECIPSGVTASQFYNKGCFLVLLEARDSPFLSLSSSLSSLGFCAGFDAYMSLSLSSEFQLCLKLCVRPSLLVPVSRFLVKC